MLSAKILFTIHVILYFITGAMKFDICICYLKMEIIAVTCSKFKCRSE
jgi:hypothetical protein